MNRNSEYLPGSASLPTSPVAPVAPSSAVASRLARSSSDSQAEKGTGSEGERLRRYAASPCGPWTHRRPSELPLVSYWLLVPTSCSPFIIKLFFFLFFFLPSSSLSRFSSSLSPLFLLFLPFLLLPFSLFLLSPPVLRLLLVFFLLFLPCLLLPFLFLLLFLPCSSSLFPFFFSLSPFSSSSSCSLSPLFLRLLLVLFLPFFFVLFSFSPFLLILWFSFSLFFSFFLFSFSLLFSFLFFFLVYWLSRIFVFVAFCFPVANENALPPPPVASSASQDFSAWWSLCTQSICSAGKRTVSHLTAVACPACNLCPCKSSHPYSPSVSLRSPESDAYWKRLSDKRI